MSSPARSSICGPSAAVTTGGDGAPGMVTCPVVVIRGPWCSTGSPASAGMSTSRYSRRNAAGRS
nr:hypothetical protein [Mycolicibacterium septicum]